MKNFEQKLYSVLSNLCGILIFVMTILIFTQVVCRYVMHNSLTWSEVYTGLQQHTIDAQENPIPFIYGGRIQEVQTHISLTAHKYEYVTLAMSDKKFQGLSKEQQDIIVKAAKTATDYENNLVVTETEKLLNEMVEKNGLIVVKPNIEPFAELAVKAHMPYAQSIGMEDLLNRINKELGR